MIVETQPWAAIAVTRQGLYRMFAGALLPPEPGLPGTLHAAADYLEAQELTRFAFYPQWVSFRTAVAAAPTADELAVDYVRLFASGVDGALCPPTESWYRSDARSGGAAEVVAALEADYRSLGLAVVGSSEPPDHAAIELEAMSALCAQEGAAWSGRQDPAAAKALGREDRFLRSHLATWFGDFAVRVRRIDPDGWYRSVTDVVDAFVVHDVDLVRALRRQLGVV